MSNVIKLNPAGENIVPEQQVDSEALVEVFDDIVIDNHASLANKDVMSMPIAQLAKLGAGVASMLHTFRTITETTAGSGETLLRWVNEGAGNTLKLAKDGNYWGAYKTADGASKFAKFQPVTSTGTTTTTVMPIDPVTIMMAVALFSLEQKMGEIARVEREILDLLETEKEAKIEADVEMLATLIEKYKHNWDNEHYVASNHKLVLDIQRSAREHLIDYQKQVSDILNSKKLVVSQSKVNDALNKLLKKFKYYRMSLQTFSMASFVEVMLSGNFKEENILLTKSEIEKRSDAYRELFGQCSVYLEKLSDSSLEVNLLKGLGSASKAVGKFIDSIPVVREGQVDEFLQESGTKIKSNAAQMERQIVASFAKISNPGIWVFMEKLNDMIKIYGRTETICFDQKNIYLIAG